jgi:flavin-dependent dehydrogenase
MEKKEIIIIGGGLGGLTAAALLARNGRNVLLIEKKTYPFHRVCGEYISNEVREFLKMENLYPEELQPAEINRFRLTSTKGKMVEMGLDLGGFGISRYAFDDFMYHQAKAMGARFMLNTQVEQVEYHQYENKFTLELNSGETLSANYLIGAFGKRSKMDKVLSRRFIKDRTPFIGVKYHLQGDFEKNLIALHNFRGGYCGINPIEKDRFCLCYLGDKQQLRDFGNIPAMEKNILYENPFLKTLFENSSFLYEKPEVINEINFSPKAPVENHILMIGDAAGMITPLCGNGMAIAIHTGKLAAEALLNNHSRSMVEKDYIRKWRTFFKNRLAVGRAVQKLFGTSLASELAVGLLQKSPFLGRQLMKRTHGKAFHFRISPRNQMFSTD